MFARLAKNDEGGQAIIEFVVVFPVFAVFVIGILHGAWILLRVNAIESGAAEGARLAAVSGCSSWLSCSSARSDIVARVKDHARGALDSVPSSGNCSSFGSASRAICVQWMEGPDGQDAGDIGSTVRVRTKFTYEFPIGGADYVIESCKVTQLERRVTDPPSEIAAVGFCP